MKRRSTPQGSPEGRGRREKKPNIQDDPAVVNFLTELLLRPLLLECMSYLDQESLRQVCVLSKEFEDIVRNDPLMKIELIPLLKISPDTTQNDEGRFVRLLRLLYNLQYRDKLQRYKILVIIDAHKFKCKDWCEGKLNFWFVVRTPPFRLNGIVSLDISLPPSSEPQYCQIPKAFPSILSNLRELNLSNTCGYGHSNLKLWSKECTHLEKITWNNLQSHLFVSVDGKDMRPARNLKEIYMDGACLFGLLTKFADLDDDKHSHIFLFHKLNSKVLEKVSIKNVRSYCRSITRTLPQNALIKFIRNAPMSLRWFRSDLSQDNINMLRSERPEIEFV